MMRCGVLLCFFFFSSRRRHTRCGRDWSSDVCSSDLELIRLAGHGAALGPAGVDGVYGNGTAEGLRLCRADVGSRALPGYGDQVTGHAFAQLIAAVAKHQATKVSGGSTGGVPRHLEVESLTAKRLTVG